MSASENTAVSAEVGAASKAALRIASCRRQICPRTAYASAGSVATTLNILNGIESEQGCLIKCVLETGEFDKCRVCDLKDKTTDGVYLIKAEEGEGPFSLASSIRSAEELIVNRNIPLVFIHLQSAKSADELEHVARETTGSSEKNFTVSYNAYGGNLHLLICHARQLTDFSSTPASQKVTSWGSQGQPAVKSRQQFRYLWSNAYNLGAEVGMTDCGKQRVLQRLADKTSESGQKWTSAEWDSLVSEALQQGQDDFGIYSLIRLKVLGSTLEDDLVVKLDDGDGMPVAEAEATFAFAEAGEGGEDGRAGFMVKMTLECVPDDIKNKIGSVLDYGCAEGAITAELGKQLHLPASRVYGADVRAIPADGFSFVQLPEESLDQAPEVGSILPSLKNHSVMLVTSAMVMHHVRHAAAAMRELRRVIHPKGVLVMREHHCDGAEMGAFLDITHGLYSLAWSVPVEWPKFLDEYQAWYRSQEDWDQLMASAGFRRVADHFRINKHYEAAKSSRLKERDGRITNVIKAYYATYLPDPTWNGEVGEERVKSSAGAGARALQSQGQGLKRTREEATTANSMWGTSLPPAPAPAPTSSVEKEEREEEGSHKKARMEPETVFVPEISTESGVTVIESRSNRGFFYVTLQNGKTLWVSLFFLADLRNPEKNTSLPLHPQKSTLQPWDHPVEAEGVGFLDSRKKKVMRVAKIKYID